MNNPKTRDDDERSSIANQTRQNQTGTEEEARRVVEGSEADQRSQQNQGIVRDDRSQTQPADKKRAQKSQTEGPAAYAPHEGEDIRSTSGDPAKKKTGEF